MKKIFTLFAALAMVMSMFAVDIPAGTKLYLTPNSNWKQSNARFAAYFFGNGEAWVSMTKVAGETDLYEVTSPGKSYTNVIFCRMNPSAPANNWNNKWDQTNDLSYDGTNNHYTVKEGTWNKGGGTWSKYVTTVTITIQADNGTVTGLATDGEYEGGTQATLTAVPNDGYEFVNWTVGGKEVSTANPYTFTVSDNITLVANFKEAAAKAYTITTSATNGTAEGAATVVEGESVTLTATADPGYKFVNWTVGGVEVSTDNPYTFVPTEDATVVANFEQLPPETVYFVNAADWEGTINIHAWGGTAPGTTWPGNPAQKEDYQIGGHDVYSLTAAAGAYANVIFNNKVGDAGNQTKDLQWTAGKYYVLDDWYTKEEAEEKLATPVPTYDYYITGSLVGGWNPDQQGLVKDGELYKATFTELNAGTYEFKITAGDWEHQWNYSNLGAAYEEVSQGVDGEGNPNGNIKIVTEEAKNITVIFDATAGKITLEGLTEKVPEPVVMTTIYLNTGGSGLWNNEGAKFFAHSWKEGVGNEQDKELTLVEGDLYKLDVPEDHDMIIFLRLAPTATDVVWNGDKYWNKTENLTIPSDQNCYTITAWGENSEVCKGTWSSYTYDDGNALDNVNTTVAPVKAIVNGQLVIIRNGVKYNVAGAVVK